MSQGFVTGASWPPRIEEPSYFNRNPPALNVIDDDSEPASPHDQGTDIHPNAFRAPHMHQNSPSLDFLYGHDKHSATQEEGPHHPLPSPFEEPHRPNRAHFPDELSQLEKRITAVPPPGSESMLDPVETERVPSFTDHRGILERFKDYWDDLKADFGASHPHYDLTNVIGDTGIDVQTLKMLRKKEGVSILVGSSLMLSAPGMSHRGSIQSLSSIGTSASTPETPTPLKSRTPGTITPSKRFMPGIDPKEVARALHKLKDKIGHSDKSKEAKYVQAKTDLASRRTLALLFTYCFMLYGAPSHRLEEYILALFKVCNVDGCVNYIVGCTEICFVNPPDPADPMTRQSYTTLVKAQGLDVGALEIAFRIYKNVIHGKVSIADATKSLISLIESPPYHKPWLLVPVYGLASAFACIWAYNGYWTDMPVAFLLGSVVGVLQVIVASRNPLYANVLEVTAALVTSFGARAFATIGGPDQKYFCFGPIAESSITTILPGYIVLCGALELQSKSVTAGSTRLFYAVMYSLFLGYGIDVGSQLWAVIDSNAPTSATCPRTVDPRWKILLVPCYLVLQATLIRSRPQQIPIQVLFGSAAYTVNYFVGKVATAQIADTASAFTLGILGHMYARSRHAFAFASVVAGVMVLVPSGISAQGGLISGISTPLFNNGTTNANQVYEQNLYQSFSVGAQMIQVSVGLSVGLFLSALTMYPLGKKSSAVFSL